MDTADVIDERALSKLRWRCRRGLLENDLFIERFFQRHGEAISPRLADAMTRLMDLSDNDLLDVLLARKSLAQVEPSLDEDNVQALVKLLREPF